MLLGYQRVQISNQHLDELSKKNHMDYICSKKPHIVLKMNGEGVIEMCWVLLNAKCLKIV